MYDTIVVPVDGSEHSIRAGEHGLALARRYGATVHVVSVVDVQRAAGLFSAGGIDEAFVDRVERVGWDAVRRIEAIAEDADDVRSAIVRGPPWKAPSVGILEYAADHGADLIVMGTQGRTGLDRVVAGSVTERVVRHSPIPVLTVRAADRDLASDYDRILVPTDGSDCATAAVEHAVSIAEAYDASVHVLFVVDVASVAMEFDGAPYTVLRNDIEAKGEAATAAIESTVRDAGLDAVTAIEEGFPVREIIEYAADHEVDLIVMGTHGRMGLDRVVLGSTTARVLRRADVPVLAVKPNESDRTDEPEAVSESEGPETASESEEPRTAGGNERS